MYKGICGKFFQSFLENNSISVARVHLNPASSKPISSPPAPEKSEINVF